MVLQRRSVEPQRPPLFREVGELPPSLKVPGWLWAVGALAVVLGCALGLGGDRPLALRLVRAVFFASALGYLTSSLVDFWEHFRLEREATGRYLSSEVVPLGETLNHAATSLVIILMLILARPLPPTLEARDWFVLVSPGLFVALGWRDELVYHRRRSSHREDIMHTVAHLAAGVMIATFLVSRLVRW